MNPFLIPLLSIAVVYTGVIALNERYNLLSADRFSWKAGAYGWLGLFLFGLTILVTGAALRTPTAKELASTPFYRIFALPWILIIFLFVWWLLTGRPHVAEFLNIRPERAAGEEPPDEQKDD